MVAKGVSGSAAVIVYVASVSSNVLMLKLPTVGGSSTGLTLKKTLTHGDS